MSTASIGPGLPPQGDELTSRAFWFSVAVTVLVFAAGIYSPNFIVDSWSYVELSKTVFHDFFRFSTLRQFESTSPYSNSFPPLWPVLLALTGKVLHLGIYNGYLLNLFTCIALLAALIRLFRNIGFPGWLGAVCYLAILGFTPFLGDALGAKTFPLSLTLLIGTLAILFCERITRGGVALAGALMGFACLNRFDAMPTACLLGVLFAARTTVSDEPWRRRAVTAAVYFATFAVVLSPWVAYGMKHFGKPFPSDNVRQAVRAVGGNVLDYFETPPVSDLARNPRKWIAALVSVKARKVASSLVRTSARSALPVLLVFVLSVWCAVRRRPRLSLPALWFTVLALVLIPVVLLPTILAGYEDSRYFSGPALFVFAILLGTLFAFDARGWNARRVAMLMAAFTLPLIPAVVNPLRSHRGSLLSATEARDLIAPSPEMLRVAAAVQRDAGGQPHRLILSLDELATARYGAITGDSTTVMPRLNGHSFASFARDWHVTHVYDPPVRATLWAARLIVDPAEIMRTIEAPGVRLIPLDLPGLYRLQLVPVSQPASPSEPSGAQTGQDDWIYAGTVTSHGGKGIYLYKLHAGSGKVDSMGLAAGRIWQANNDTLLGGPLRMFAQMRAGWPSLKAIVKGVFDTSLIALSPNGRYLFSANSDVNTIAAFRPDEATGKLTILGTEPSAGENPVSITVDRSGKYLLVANYSGALAVLPIDASGRLGRAVSVIQQGAGQRQRARPHSITMSPDNRFALSADTALDEVVVYRFDAAHGRLTANEPPFVSVAPGTGPRHFVFHPKGVFGYAVGESGSCVVAMQWDAKSGALTPIQTVSTLPADFHGQSGGGDLIVHPNGRFLYASNRGHDSIAVFAINPADGKLTFAQLVPSSGKRPINLLIDPAGNYLFSANVLLGSSATGGGTELNGSNIAEFRIDRETGRLTPMETLSVPFPIALAIRRVAAE
jgi:6-phosphogluconolactonase